MVAIIISKSEDILLEDESGKVGADIIDSFELNMTSTSMEFSKLIGLKRMKVWRFTDPVAILTAYD